jgi:hypothetical protein
MAVWAKKKKDYPFPLYAAAPCREKDIARRVGRPAIPMAVWAKKDNGYRTPPASTGGWAGASREEEEEMRPLVGRRL